MAAYPDEGSVEGVDLEKEQRRERLGWIFWGVSAMLFVVCLFYLQMVSTERVIHAYAVTVLTYGTLLYVEEFEHLKKGWLWKGLSTTVPIHIMFLCILLWWDGKYPRLAQTGYMFANAIAVVYAVEMVVFTMIIDRFKARASLSEPPRKLKRLFTWTTTPKRQARKIITMLDETGESDAAKEARENYMKWSFYGVSTVLLAT